MTLYNPFTGYRVSQGWRQGSHALPGGGPAIDYAMPTGTPLPSPTVGTVWHSSGGAAGNVATIWMDDGRRIVYCHLSRFATANGARVRAADVVGYAGESGVANGPHLHTYGLTARGARWNWTIKVGPAPAGMEEVDVALTNAEMDKIAEKVAAKVWDSILGVKGSTTVSHGRAGDLLAQANARAGKAATRAQAILLGEDAE